MEFTHRPIIGTYRAWKRRWTSPQDNLHLTAAGPRQSTVEPLWDGLTSHSSTAHVGHHVRPLRRLAHLRTVRLGVAFATSSRWHLPSWWYMTPHIIRDRAGAIRPDFSVCVECSARPKWLLPLIAAFSLTPGKRKGLGVPFGFSGGRSAAISGGGLLQLGWCVVRPVGSHRTLS